MPNPMRETARGVILRNDTFLLIRRTRQNSSGGIATWLSIPGGGLEPGETPEQAVVRELQEELGVTVKVGSLLAIQDVPPEESRHYYFSCTLLAGEPHIQEKSEEYERMQGKVPNTYAVEWTRSTSPKLPHSLFWATSEAYIRFKSFITVGRTEPLSLLTTGDASSPMTVVRN